MFKKSAFVLALFLFFFISVKSISAHGTATSFSKDVGNYSLEFEYDDPQVIAGETTSYVFRLLDQKTKQPVTFDAVLLRIERKSDQSTMLVTRATQDELQDGVGRLTAMLDQGSYTVTSSYYKGGNKVTEANFDLTVQKADTGTQFPTIPVAIGLGGLVLGFVIGKLSGRGSAKHAKE